MSKVQRQIVLTKQMKDRMRSSYYNTLVWSGTTGKRITIADWLSRVNGAEKLVNDTTLRQQYLDTYMVELTDDNVANVLIGIDKATKEYILINADDIVGFNPNDEDSEETD